MIQWQRRPKAPPAGPVPANPLDALALKHGTDKGTIEAGGLLPKSYTVPYHRFLEAVRDDPLLLLEIGVKRGSSLRMWEDFLPKATIFGMDINPACAKHATGRRRVFIGDQGDPAFLQSVVDAAGRPFDVVIDDGSHQMAHHLASLKFLWPHLRPGGWYAIEDLHTCFSAQYGGGYRDPRSTVEEVFKPLLDSLNGPRVAPPPYPPDVESMHVYRGVTILSKERSKQA